MSQKNDYSYCQSQNGSQVVPNSEATVAHQHWLCSTVGMRNPQLEPIDSGVSVSSTSTTYTTNSTTETLRKSAATSFANSRTTSAESLTTIEGIPADRAQNAKDEVDASIKLLMERPKLVKTNSYFEVIEGKAERPGMRRWKSMMDRNAMANPGSSCWEF